MKDLSNKVFDRLTALSPNGKSKHDKIIWKCLCSCGNYCNILGDSLLRGITKSCGCLSSEKKRGNKRSEKHGLSYSRIYYVWGGIKSRCLNPNNEGYSNYGGRGITLCDRWLVFNNFKEDMYESYLEHSKMFGEYNTTIERIKTSEGYSKDNCKWATRQEQFVNRRSTVYFTAISPEGISYEHNNISEFCRIYGLYSTRIRKCLSGEIKSYRGWTFIKKKGDSYEDNSEAIIL